MDIPTPVAAGPAAQKAGAVASVPSKAQPPRIALYSHDTMGLGHMRRNLLIAQTLKRQFSDATILLIAGAREAAAFAMPAGIDCVTLPAVAKDASGVYHSRHLGLSLAELVELRSAAIASVVSALGPDVLIVDKVPRGVADELVPTLEVARSRGMRCVLGLRDVMDSRDATARAWRDSDAFAVIREYFQNIWVYGDPRVFNLVDEYDLPHDIAERVRFTGYLDQSARLAFGEVSPGWMEPFPAEPFDLCVVGGGQDGEHLAECFIAAAAERDVPAVLLTGPCMPPAVARRLSRQACDNQRLQVVDFVPEADWLISRAARVVCMGGYNTVSSVLSFGKPACVVPRIRPRSEQLLRARRLAELGLLDVIHPDGLTPARLGEWLESCQRPSLRRPAFGIDLKGLATIDGMVRNWFQATHSC